MLRLWQLRYWGLIAVLIGLAIFLAVVLADTLRSVRQLESWNRSYFNWSVLNTEVDLWRMLDAAGRLAAGEGDVDRAALDQRIDILFSRIDIFHGGDFSEQFQSIEDAGAAIAALDKALNEQEGRLRALAPGDHAELSEIRAVLVPVGLRLRLAVSRVQTFEMRTVEGIVRNVENNFVLAAWLTAALLLTGIALIAFLVVEFRSRRKLLESVLASKEQARSAREREEAALIQSGRRVRAIAEANPVAVLVVDRRYRSIRYANTAARVLLGLPEADLAPLTLANVAAGRSVLEGVLDRATSETVDGYDTALSRPGRPDVPVVLSTRALDYDGAPCLVIGILDLSESRAAREAQRLAEEANRAKSDFVSNMSHELRTPLNAIIGFTEFVLENDEPISEEQRASLSQVLKAGRHLLLLINDVLDLSKIEAGAISMSIEPVEAGQVIDECVSLTTSFAAGRNVRIHNLLDPTAVPPIMADRVRFKQVFLNLLSNAIKYNADPGNVFIEQAAAAPKTVKIGVRDEGGGIAPEMLAKLFEPFDRLGAENSAIEGSGIGLTITRSLVERMGGRISVESVVGKGSTFWLEMPVSEQAVESRVDADQLVEGVARDVEGLILCIEDNPANLELVRKIMSLQPGVDFIDAQTGERGIERARSEAPDVILLDINLPGLNGFEVLDALKAMPETRHIPVIALTAAATDADVKRGRAAGFFSYLTKPVAARDLIATVRRALDPASAVPVEQPRRGKALVVDDLPINLTITQKQLTKLGIACDLVDDPVRALELLKTGAYAVALVDIGMPGMSGIELTRQLREAERKTGGYTPVVALTANYGSEDDIGRYRKAGMDAQLSKPVNLKDLASTLRRWFAPEQPVPDDAAPSATTDRARPASADRRLAPTNSGS